MSDSSNTPASDPRLAQQEGQMQGRMPGDKPDPEKKEEKRRVLGFWWFSTAILIALLLVIILSGGAFLAMSYLWQGPQKVEVETQRVENAIIFPVEGKDAQGRNAAFDFIILTDDYTWVKGSTYQVAGKGGVVAEDRILDQVVSAPIRESLNRSVELIAVGLASQEGEQAVEEQRAARRSRTILSWLVLLSDTQKPLWRLNLGQYNSACQGQQEADTSFQRPLIMVGVRSKDDGANLGEALADAISGKANLPSRECYSRFDLAEGR